MIDSNGTFSPITAAYRLPAALYPTQVPFHPAVPYPEYRWTALGETNHVYEGVRTLLHLLGLDEEHYGTPMWNPLGELIRPGDKVVLKPNYLWQSHKHRVEEWEQVITHGSVVRAVLDYVLIALKDRGEVWIAEGPQRDADWEAIVSRTGVRSVCDFCTSGNPVPVRLLDLRDIRLDVRGDVVYARVPLPGDPAGSTEVNLAHRSRFVGHAGAGRYFGCDYDQAEVNYHHTDGRHEYCLSRTAASANVFINLPKMKTHKKVGVTLCLKNLVGINTGRNWLPHHTDGDPSNGGDQFPVKSIQNTSERWGIRRLQQLTLRYPRIVAPLFRLIRKIALPIWGRTEEVIRNGNWYGNDTCWRMVHDINRCLLYTDGDFFPLMHPKRYFAVVDGVVAGDGNGPAAPDRFEAGVLVAGYNPVAVDCVVTRLMGFDPRKLAILREAFQPSDLPLAPFAYSDIEIRSNDVAWQGHIIDLAEDSCFQFRPHFGWRGKIEWNRVVPTEQ
jgi:uncharacterized protein (DUF362 family)